MGFVSIEMTVIKFVTKCVYFHSTDSDGALVVDEGEDVLQDVDSGERKYGEK